jgi:hypothetical protein
MPICPNRLCNETVYVDVECPLYDTECLCIKEDIKECIKEVIFQAECTEYICGPILPPAKNSTVLISSLVAAVIVILGIFFLFLFIYIKKRRQSFPGPLAFTSSVGEPEDGENSGGHDNEGGHENEDENEDEFSVPTNVPNKYFSFD